MSEEKMQETKADRRTKYTKMMLRQSLLELLVNKPVNKITVKELCERADINRATFYLHYYDVFDLLAQTENELFDRIKETIERESTANNMYSAIRDICIAIRENADLCKVLFGEHGNRDFISRILEIVHDKVMGGWQSEAYNMDTRHREYAYTFATSGSVGIIQDWQKHGFKEKPDEIAELINNLSSFGLSGLRK